MTGTGDLARWVPGFDFLQNLMKGAGTGMPSMSQWVAPTLNPEELEKRIQELRTVQFWLEQNAKLLGATIQALEVQRMTLSTLQTMNLPLTDLRDALKIRVPQGTPAAPSSALSAPAPAPVPAAAPAARKPSARGGAKDASDAAAGPKGGAIDPMQWWSALTQQFTALAAKAVQDSTADAGKPNAAAPAAPPRGEDAARPAAAAPRSAPVPRMAAARKRRT
jgi:hypothetical protein